MQITLKIILNGFSENVKDILHRMKFEDQIKTMKEGKVLYQVISDFNSTKADMSPEKISAVDMGYIFENLVQRFQKVMTKKPGALYQPRYYLSHVRPSCEQRQKCICFRRNQQNCL